MTIAAAGRTQSDEDSWRSLQNAGLEALRQGRYPEAESLFLEAVRRSEKLQDERRAASLNELARAYRYQGNQGEAETYARQSLAILEKALGPQHSGILDSLVNLVAAVQIQARYAEAAQLYGRILTIRWSGPPGPSTAPAETVLEDFAAVLSLGYTRDAGLESALKEFRESLALASLNKDLYVAMRDGLLSVTLVGEAEALMQRAVQAFPESRQLRFQLAELYVKSEKHQKALEIFKEASAMAAHLDPEVERTQRSLIYEKMAEVNTLLVRFDDAFAAARMALEIHPGSAGPRLILANLYLRRNMLDEAAEEYARVVSVHPESAAAYYGLAQADLSMGRFPEAAAAAGTALGIDPADQRSRYVRAMALIRSGRNDEGQRVLQDYLQIEEDRQAADQGRQEISELNRKVVALLREDRKAAAIESLREGIRSHPGAALLYLKLGLLQGELGLHRDAVDTFQSMIRLKIDDFLVHRNLYREYEILGDISASQRHRAIYLQRYDADLRARLN